VGYGAPLLWLGLRLKPVVHRQRIAERARAQFEGGLLDEAATLRERYEADLPAFAAFGYREAMAHLQGELSREEALERTIGRTRAYARRQRTWFRAEPQIRWLESGDQALAAATELVRRFLGSREAEMG
jgi:tRNA dimethylallyltransferase